ncbi:MAG: 30S ribosomal protein S15 [Candidatus Harrisonbacteria bacterium CG10_big_fil_rev_8_21_14_0_10_42_17]|uniref:Small ribosomal subunit protein uS15 n=1 Tax=Candidatus Harrisonbacteria bacterium CG10_big_fil_rev_8_21_14_0_10_42_17 TaxID=1974584 RepID=A0A2M6WIS4_9BACT|nr:MAG: 30S ribosomal protein S15 [Candidatus Harrisonbacteria bacterium CG10_big_fil_rev_8_21_14_0_10_42_17]
MLTSRKKKTVIKEHSIHEADTGSAPVQIMLLTRRIEELTSHLKHNKKDVHSRRGLLKIVSKRRRLLKYLSKHDEKRYATIVKKLNLKS